MTQKMRTLRYFQTHKKGLTPLDFWTKLGIYRASDVVYRLKKDGYKIKTERINVKNQFDETCTVAYYTFHGKTKVVK